MFGKRVRICLGQIFGCTQKKRIAFYRDFIEATQPDRDALSMTREWNSVKITLGTRAADLKGVRASRDEIMMLDIENLSGQRGMGQRALEEFLIPLTKEHGMGLLVHAHKDAGVRLFKRVGMTPYLMTDHPIYTSDLPEEMPVTTVPTLEK